MCFFSLLHFSRFLTFTTFHIQALHSKNYDTVVNITDKFNLIFPTHHIREDQFVTCLSYKIQIEKQARVFNELSHNSSYWVYFICLFFLVLFRCIYFMYFLIAFYSLFFFVLQLFLSNKNRIPFLPLHHQVEDLIRSGMLELETKRG
jgi:hypothetical protein